MPSPSPLEICRVTPAEPSAQLSLPLTFFDTMWLNFRPVERIFFYRLSAPTSSPSEFHAVVLPALKRSLSLALLRFLPIAGKLTWPADADVPFILYTPGDGVSLTVAEYSTSADHDFDLLAGDAPRDAILSRPYVPELVVSGSNAAVLALQITLFPGKGFCIGVASHHAVLDGKSTVMFLKAWAHISRKGSYGDGSLPEELTPFLDRTVVKDPEGVAVDYVETWMGFSGGEEYRRTLELLPATVPTASESNLTRGSFKLSKQDIQKLRQSIIHQLESSDNNNVIYNTHDKAIKPTTNYLSTFVITYAYTLVCIAKAKRLGDDHKVLLSLSADCRSRLEPTFPPNYFGNCVMSFTGDGLIPVADLVHGAAGLAFAARKLVEVIREVEKGVLVGAKGKLARFVTEAATRNPAKILNAAVAGSPRFGVYGVDFGYGRPEKVEITSIDESSAMSMAESGDGSDGVEVGVVLQKHEMDEFSSAFFEGLAN